MELMKVVECLGGEEVDAHKSSLTASSREGGRK